MTVIRKATPGQLKKISDVFRGVPREQAQALLGSGLFPILRDANVSGINPDDFRRLCGLRFPTPAVIASPFLPVPADGEEFELTINGDEVDPLAMVRQDGCRDYRDWRFNGPRVSGTHTRRFTLIRFGYCRNLAEVTQGVGKIVEGQWREAFRQKYPRPGGRGPIGFGGSEWVDSDDDRRFPCLYYEGERWNSLFYWATSRGFFERWRWLVEVSK